MKLGANSRNVAAVAVLIPVAAYMVYSNIFAGGSSSGASSAPPAPVRMPERLQTIDLAQDSARAVAGGGPRTSAMQGRARRAGGGAQEWTPRVGGRRPEDRADPAKTDPTLRLELLAKLQSLSDAAAGRSLFDFTTAPAPKPLPPDVKIVPKKGASTKGEEPKPTEPAPAPSGPPPEPPPPPIPLKFYGFVQGEGGKRAFFRLGEEDIFVASEGQTVQGRYRIVRIGLSSAMVEDMQHKNNQQSLRLEEIPRESI